MGKKEVVFEKHHPPGWSDKTKAAWVKRRKTLPEFPTYRAVHKRICRRYGTAKKCIYCGKDSGLIDWANINGVYNDDIRNYVQLCRGCHIRLYRYKSITICLKNL